MNIALDTMGIWYKLNCIWYIDECGVQDAPEQEEVIGVVNEPAFHLVSREKIQTTTILTFVSASSLQNTTNDHLQGSKG